MVAHLGEEMSGKYGIEITKKVVGGLFSTVAFGVYCWVNRASIKNEWSDIQGDEIVDAGRQVFDVEFKKIVAVLKPDTTTP